MAHYWLIVTLSWVGTVSLQYISNAYPDQLISADNNNKFNDLDTVLNPQHNEDHFSSGPGIGIPIDEDRFQRESTMFDMLLPQIILPPSLRPRRTPEMEETQVQFPNYSDTDRTALLPSESHIVSVPRIVHNYEKHDDSADNNASDIGEQKMKRSFSPWGGKRDGKSNTWTWKRASMREPSMPKRVRFSPWGGKRSSQVIFKPGAKALKIIFSKSIPDLTRIISSYTPNGGGSFNVARFQVIPGNGKRNPISILALTSKLNDRTLKDALPFKAFIETAKIFKPGHPYADINLRKDEKRKVKFSAWGGKRSPPVIGPIWSPATQMIQDHALDKILLIRKEQSENENMIKAL